MPGYAKEAWKLFRDDWPMSRPDDSYWLNLREIADRPAGAAEAWSLLYGIVNTHVERLKKLLAERLDLESVPDPDWTDRAAMDLSLEFERHRRYQSAKTRELLRTIEAFCKLRKASDNGKADDTCQMADGTGQMAEGEYQMADGTGGVVARSPDLATGADRGSPACPGRPAVDRTAGSGDPRRTAMADGLTELAAEGETSPKKVTNEAKLEMTQVQDIQELVSENRKLARRERSQIAGDHGLPSVAIDRLEGPSIITCAARDRAANCSLNSKVLAQGQGGS